MTSDFFKQKAAEDIMLDLEVILGRKILTDYLINFTKKRILITGAGGIIGSEICKRLLMTEPEILYLIGHGESSMCRIMRDVQDMQTKGIGEKTKVQCIIGDITDLQYVNYTMNEFNIEIIIHCASYKNIPMIEKNPIISIKNNVFGTKNLLDFFVTSRICKKFIYISTDKAVKPTSIYGITKMLCEKMILDYANKTNPEQAIMAVRLCNVITPNSVFDVFEKQIKNNIPISITDEKMERAFITITEATYLILMAAKYGKNQLIYYLNIAQPIRIIDIPPKMGNKNKIVITGKRAGERIKDLINDETEIDEISSFSDCINEIKSTLWKTSELLYYIRELESICYYNENKKNYYMNINLLKSIIKDLQFNI